jgi:hypothetical protein
MNRWLGRTINEAIMQLGPPSGTYELPKNGMIMYSWLQVGGTRMTTLYLPSLNMMTTGASTPWCQISLTADSTGYIQAWKANGNACLPQ